jgi:hypothetical protein
LPAFAVGAVVALLVGAFGMVHDPSLAGLTSAVWYLGAEGWPGSYG